MDLTGRIRPVVVGVDGSGPAAAAAGAAAEEARRRLLPLRLVRALPGTVSDPPAQHPSQRGPRRAAVSELAALRRSLLEHLPGGSVGLEVRAGPPIWVLLQEATSAELLVVGSNGTGHPGPHLGTVAAALAQRSPCPVLVVRAGAGPVAVGAPVVVAVDRGPATGQLLSMAMLEAVTRGTGLEVLPVRPPGTPDAEDGAALAAAVGDLARTCPGVPVQLHPPAEGTVTALAREARGAALLVVRRGDPDGEPAGPPLRPLLAGVAASVLVVPLAPAPGRAPAPVHALHVSLGARS